MKSYISINVAIFILFHLIALGIFFVPFSWHYVFVAVASYYSRMFFVTAAYHRYFSHRSFKAGRIFQFVMAFLAMTSSQKGVLWWASHHRQHHQYSDRDEDVHSPHHGWWWSHIGWFLSDRFNETDGSKIQDFYKYPELRWLDRHWTLPVWAYAGVLYLLGGWPYILWGFFLATVFLWHGTFTINSVAHLWGTRRYNTKDDSRNNFLLALITLGEGWHNNHHRFPGAVKSGIRWWEVDLTFHGLQFLSWMKIVSLRSKGSRSA